MVIEQYHSDRCTGNLLLYISRGAGFESQASNFLTYFFGGQEKHKYPLRPGAVEPLRPDQNPNPSDQVHLGFLRSGEARVPPTARMAAQFPACSGSSSRSGASSRRRRQPGKPIPYRQLPFDYEPAVLCECGEKMPQWISWSDPNPGRRYRNCKIRSVSLRAPPILNFLEPAVF